MEKVKYSGECELKTRTAYHKGCTFPTMLRIQEVCCESEPNGQYPVKCFINCNYYIMDDEQRLEWELEERYDILGETDIHCLCHAVQTIPIYHIDSQPLRERVYNFGRFISEYSEIDGESTYDNSRRFIQGELVFVLKDNYLTIGVVRTNSLDGKTYPLLVIDENGNCNKEEVIISRILKYRDVLERIDLETVYKLKKQLYSLSDDPADATFPIWLAWKFFETTCSAEEFGMKVYTVPIPNSHANKIIGKDVELSDDGWHYRIVGDDDNTERMLWGYMTFPMSFDNLPIHRVEKIIQDGFPIYFDLHLRNCKNIFTSDLSNKAIAYHKKLINRFISEYNEGVRQMSKNYLDTLAEHISIMEKLITDTECTPEQKDISQTTIEKGKEVLKHLIPIKSFLPYGLKEGLHNG